MERKSRATENAFLLPGLVALAVFVFAASSWSAVPGPQSREVEVEEGGSLTLDFTPAAHYRIADVLVDGRSVGAVSTYTLSRVERDALVDVTFAPAPEILVPVVAEPVSGGTTTSTRPVLSVYNPLVVESLTYEFEVAADAGFTDVLASQQGVAQGLTVTPWTVPVDLPDKARFYWRVRAADAAVTSPWCQTATFVVDVEGRETTVALVSHEYLRADADNTFQVALAEGSPAALVVEIPADALLSDALFTAGPVENGPASGEGVTLAGRVFEVGPHGVPFQKPATVSIPYSEEELRAAGVSDPSELGVFTYNTQTLAWEGVSVESVDLQAKRLVCKVTHFSLYTLGVSDGDATGGGSGKDPTTGGPPTTGGEPTQASGGGGGGGGGCFVAAAGGERGPGGGLVGCFVGLLLTGALVMGTARSRTSRVQR